MNREYIESNDVIARYIRNQLAEDELNLFEVYLLDNPDILDEVRIEERIHKEFQNNSALLRSKGDSPPQDNRINYRVYAMAASVLFAALLLVPLLNLTGPRLQEPVLLESFRGQEQFVYEISGEPIIQFLLDAGADSEGAFSISLIEVSSGDVIARANDLLPTSEGLVPYSLADTGRLLGRYTLILLNSENESRRSFELNFL